MTEHAPMPIIPRMARPVILIGIIAVSIALSACASTGVTRPEAFPRSREISTEPSGPRAEPGVLAPAVIRTAMALKGTPYKLGGNSPEEGFDCSGFVSYVLRQHAVTLPRTVAEQFAAGEQVARDDLRAGDLVFFSTTGPGATHVGLVVGTDTAIEFVHAPADGASVRVERLDTSYWQRRWLGARRVLATETGLPRSRRSAETE